jgi:broad specificity phosphatase PhoE
MVRRQPPSPQKSGLSGEQTTVMLIRHGQTPLNVADVLRGRSDPHLDEIGLLQAQSLVPIARRLKAFEVVTSPLVRAVETGEVIARALGIPSHTDLRLIDRDYGAWTGLPAVDIPEELLKVGGADGVEPWEQLCARATQAILSETDHWRGGCIIVVAHDAVNRAILSSLVEGLGPAQSIKQRTGCWNHLERKRDEWTLRDVDALPEKSVS